MRLTSWGVHRPALPVGLPKRGRFCRVHGFAPVAIGVLSLIGDAELKGGLPTWKA